VRELRNLVERLLILAPGPVIRPTDLPPLPGAGRGAGDVPDLFRCNDFQDFKAQAEAIFLQQKLREHRFNVSKTAEVLGMQRSNLYKKITKYGLQTQIEDGI
jgi:DNA-binding NtrC family response regulator